MKNIKINLGFTALVSVLFFGLIFRFTAFMWMTGDMIRMFIMIMTGLFWIIALAYGWNRKTKILHHASVVLVVFWTMFYIQDKIKLQLDKSIETQSEILISSLEDYRNRFDVYPSSLDVLELQDFDFKTALGWDIEYKFEHDSSFYIQTRTFDGFTKCYRDGHWFHDD